MKKAVLRLAEVESERKSLEEKSTEFREATVRARREDLVRRLESWWAMAFASQLCGGDDILSSPGQLIDLQLDVVFLLEIGTLDTKKSLTEYLAPYSKLC